MKIESTGRTDAAKIQKLVEQAVQAAGVDVRNEVKEIVGIFKSNDSVNVVGGVSKTQLTGAVREIAGVPEIDEPDSEQAKLADLEKLIADLTIEDEKTQAETAKKRIQSLLKQLERAHNQVLGRLKEALDRAMLIANDQKRNKIFGWIMKAIMAVAMLAAAVVTMGAATPIAIAGLAFAVAGTLLSLTETVLDATGVKDKHIEKRAKEILKASQEKSEKTGEKALTYSEALAKAEGEWSMGFGIATAALGLCAMGCGIVSLFKSAASNAIKFSNRLLKALQSFCSKANVQKIAKLAAVLTSIIGTGMGITSTVFAFEDANAMKELAKHQALLKEAEAVLDKIKELLETEEATLKDLLQQLQEALGSLASLLGGECDTSSKIVEKMTLSV